MIVARRGGSVAYSQFSDHDREAIGETEAEVTDVHEAIETGKDQIEAWMNVYRKNRWENQPLFVEVWIEKKALQGVFGPMCEESDVALCPCKGYPSLTFLHDASGRFRRARERRQSPVMIYFGDHDPSGEDIPRSIEDNLANDFGVSVDVQVIALNKNQCLELDLPAAPVKVGDSRSAKFEGLGQVELDAVRPEILQRWVEDAIGNNFDSQLYGELVEQESGERIEYQRTMRDHVNGLES